MSEISASSRRSRLVERLVKQIRLSKSGPAISWHTVHHDERATCQPREHLRTLVMARAGGPSTTLTLRSRRSRGWSACADHDKFGVSDMDRVAKAAEGGFVEGFAERWVDVDGAG